MSRMCLVDHDWQGANTEHLPKQFLVKIATYLQMTEFSSKTEGFGCFSEVEKTQKQEENLRNMHNTEVAAYNILQRLNEVRISVPKVYAARSFTSENRIKGFIIMEYMNNTTTFSYSDDITVDQALQVFRNISYLQSMTKGLLEEETKAFTTNMYATIAPDIFTPAFLADLLLLENGYFFDLVPQITELFEEVLCIEEFVSLDNLNKTLGMNAVLTHCDLWAANILWRKVEKKDELQVAAVIDFQSLKYENGALDLMRIMMQIHPEIRRSQWKNVLETFYSYIPQDCGDKLPYTLEQLNKSYIRLFPMLGVCTVLGIGAFLAHLKTTNNQKAVPALLGKTRCLFEDMFKYHKKNKDNKI